MPKSGVPKCMIINLQCIFLFLLIIFDENLQKNNILNYNVDLIGNLPIPNFFDWLMSDEIILKLIVRRIRYQ